VLLWRESEAHDSVMAYSSLPSLRKVCVAGLADNAMLLNHAKPSDSFSNMLTASTETVYLPSFTTAANPS